MNCLIIDDDKLVRVLFEKYLDKIEFVNSHKSFSSAVEAMPYLQQEGGAVDLIFLDIEMPEMTGVEFMKAFGDQMPQVIMVSSKERYAVNAFEFSVTDYLLKPVSFARFYKAIEKARGAAQVEIASDFQEFFIKRNSGLVRVKFDDIIWIEALENYIVINTYDKKFTAHHTLKAIVEKLPKGRFFRIHRSYVVNGGKIEMISANRIEVQTEKERVELPLGKSYRDDLLNGINVLSK